MVSQKTDPAPLICSSSWRVSRERWTAAGASTWCTWTSPKRSTKVPTARLLKKLKAHGVEGNVAAWVKAWLNGRTQRVSVRGKFSSWQQVLSGVPQGSVLGPVLFSILINDLDCTATAQQIIKKFADDTKVAQVINGPEDAAELQRTLDKLCEWAAWAPWLQADIDCLEAVQKRAVKIISGLRANTYEERLRELGLPSLQARRLEIDMVQTYKIVNNMDTDNSELWFERADSRRVLETVLLSTICCPNETSTITRGTFTAPE